MSDNPLMLLFSTSLLQGELSSADRTRVRAQSANLLLLKISDTCYLIPSFRGLLNPFCSPFFELIAERLDMNCSGFFSHFCSSKS